jgi:hypothetical protein
MDENGDIVGYWFSQDFNQLRKYDPIYFDAFGFKEVKDGSLIYVISDYQVGKTYFTDPSYLAGLPYAVRGGNRKLATLRMVCLSVILLI